MKEEYILDTESILEGIADGSIVISDDIIGFIAICNGTNKRFYSVSDNIPFGVVPTFEEFVSIYEEEIKNKYFDCFLEEIDDEHFILTSLSSSRQ